MEDLIHIIPINDLKEHTEKTNCECNPKLDFVGEQIIVIHNAYDMREVVEEGGKLLNFSYDFGKDN